MDTAKYFQNGLPELNEIWHTVIVWERKIGTLAFLLPMGLG
jgi:hypothetical protein